jgi:hypothetical protein
MKYLAIITFVLGILFGLTLERQQLSGEISRADAFRQIMSIGDTRVEGISPSLGGGVVTHYVLTYRFALPDMPPAGIPAYNQH